MLGEFLHFPFGSRRPSRPAFATAALVIACAAVIAKAENPPARKGGGTVRTVSAPAAEPGADLAPRLRATLSRLPHAQTVCGACVIDLRTGQAVFNVNADAPLVPASTMKVFSMVAALVELGPGFAFETTLATDGRRLYVIGDGDPGFGDERIHTAKRETIYAPFDRWAQKLNSMGFADFPDGLIIDESIFDSQFIHPTWEAEDLGKWYAAPVGGLNLNDNCVDLTATPTRPGDLVAVSVRPENPRIEIRNNCRTGQGEPVLRHAFGSFEYRLEGRTAKPWPFGAVAFPDPGLLFAESLRAHLGRSGVRVAGEISRERIRLPDGTIPAGLTVIETHRTALADCLARAGKNSQNLFAECLLKRAGYAMSLKSGAAPAVGSWETGAAAVARIVGTAGIDAAGLRVADGSGLSRENTCTARQLASILAWSNGQPFRQMLHDSLAEAGVDGSLRKRLKNLDGRIHAKTGTMRGIRTLAGYVDADSGPRYAFAIMFNNYKGGSAPYKEIQDRFCRVLAEFSEPRP